MCKNEKDVVVKSTTLLRSMIYKLISGEPNSNPGYGDST